MMGNRFNCGVVVNKCQTSHWNFWSNRCNYRSFYTICYRGVFTWLTIRCNLNSFAILTSIFFILTIPQRKAINNMNLDVKRDSED